MNYRTKEKKTVIKEFFVQFYPYERAQLKKILGDKYSSDHFAFYLYLIKNKMLPVFRKSNSTISKELDISIGKIKLIKKDLKNMNVISVAKEKGRTDKIKLLRIKKQKDTVKCISGKPDYEKKNPVTGTNFDRVPGQNPTTNNSKTNKRNEEVSGSLKSKIFLYLTKYHLDSNQIHFILKNYSPKYIKLKIKQFLYIKKHYPEKIKGDQTYLYCSIKNDWKDSNYLSYLGKNITKKNKSEYLNQEHNAIEIIDYEKEYSRYVELEIENFCKTLSPQKIKELEKNAHDMTINKKFYKENELFYKIGYEENLKDLLKIMDTELLGYNKFIILKKSLL